MTQRHSAAHTSSTRDIHTYRPLYKLSKFSSIVALYLDKGKDNRKKGRKYWAHRSLKLRRSEGEFDALYV